MCFSLEADLAAAAALTPVGVLAVREASGARRLLPLAALPLLLAVHQAIEAVVWLGLDGQVDPGIQAAAVRAYLLIAAPLLPMLVPVAIALAEDVPARRRAMWPFAAVGWAVGLWLSWVVLANPVEARELDHAIDFRTEPSLEHAAGGVYLVATLVPAALSSHRWLRAFGAVNLLGAVVVFIAHKAAFASLWCFWAALASVLVLAHLRGRHSRGVGLRALSAPRDVGA